MDDEPSEAGEIRQFNGKLKLSQWDDSSIQSVFPDRPANMREKALVLEPADQESIPTWSLTDEWSQLVVLVFKRATVYTKSYHNKMYLTLYKSAFPNVLISISTMYLGNSVCSSVKWEQLSHLISEVSFSSHTGQLIALIKVKVMGLEAGNLGFKSDFTSY